MMEFDEVQTSLHIVHELVQVLDHIEETSHGLPDTEELKHAVDIYFQAASEAGMVNPDAHEFTRVALRAVLGIREALDIMYTDVVQSAESITKEAGA